MGIIPTEFKGKLGLNEMNILKRIATTWSNRNKLEALKELKNNDSIGQGEYETALKDILRSEGMRFEEGSS